MQMQEWLTLFLPFMEMERWRGRKKDFAYSHLMLTYNADTWWRKFGCHYMWTRKGGKSKDAMLSMTTMPLIMWGRCFLAKVFAPGLLQLRTLELWLWRHGTLEVRNACMRSTSLWSYIPLPGQIFSKSLNDNFATMRNICYCKKDNTNSKQKKLT